MSVRFYRITWLVFSGVVALTFLTGNMTDVVGVVFGFFLFGLIFMGMIAVLPAGITHPAPAYSGPGFFKRAGATFGRVKGWVRRPGHSWVTSSSVEARHPKYH